MQMKHWHHSPLHIFIPGIMYIVTASTYHKQHFYKSPEARAMLQEALCRETHEHGWNLQAWAVFSNHYHFIAKSPENGADLKTLIRTLHSKTAIQINRLEKAPGRQVWFQYWDTCLTYEKSYLARLNYVIHNAVHHKIAQTAEQYLYCSAAWFAQTVEPRFYRKVLSFRFDKINVRDDF